jgi:hypothetical protein
MLGILVSCSKPHVSGIDSGSLIYLQAGTVQTKSPFEGSVPSGSSPLASLVCVSTAKDADGGYLFPSDGNDGTEDGTVGKHLPAEFQSGTAQLINGAYYNQSYPENEVYFTALHPQDGWTFENDCIANITFDGSDDVMFAPVVIGKYGNAKYPKLQFHHLLTWLKVEVVAESEEVANAWGPLQTMNISGLTSVSFSMNTAQLDSAGVNFSGNTSDVIPFYKTGNNDEVFPDADEGYLMTTAPKEVAYVLCAPVKATERDPFNDVLVRTPEYYINITSRYRDVSVPVDLMAAEDQYFKGSTMGRQFTLRLKFKMGNTVAVSAGITDWLTGGIGIGKIEE